MYTNSSSVSNFLQRDLTTYETGQMADVISAVQTWLDSYLGTSFDEATGPTTRYYDGGLSNLSIDPCTDITKVEAIDDDGNDSYEYTEGTEYIAEPQNSNVKTELRKRLGRFPYGVHRIAVTASFSSFDGSVPSDIKMAATRLAAGVINAGKSAGSDNIQSESLEGHSVTYDTGSANMEGLALSDPTISAILASHRTLLVDNYEPRTTGYNYEGEDAALL